MEGIMIYTSTEELKKRLDEIMKAMTTQVKIAPIKNTDYGDYRTTVYELSSKSIIGYSLERYLLSFHGEPALDYKGVEQEIKRIYAECDKKLDLIKIKKFSKQSIEDIKDISEEALKGTLDYENAVSMIEKVIKNARKSRTENIEADVKSTMYSTIDEVEKVIKERLLKPLKKIELQRELKAIEDEEEKDV